MKTLKDYLAEVELRPTEDYKKRHEATITKGEKLKTGWRPSPLTKIIEKLDSADPIKIAKTIKEYLKINKQYYNWNTVEVQDIWSDIWSLIEELYLNTKIYPDYEEYENEMEELVKEVIRNLTGKYIS